MPKSRVSSPARSQGAPTTPQRALSRSTRSLGSPARSTRSGRLSNIVDQFKENHKDSFAVSPLSKTVLSDNTEIEIPRRRSWWRKVENSRDVIEVLDNEKPANPNNVLEEFEIEVLSQENQEKKNYTLDYPESSDSESINSIVLPQRRLFTQKENVPQKKFGDVLGGREKLPKHNQTNFNDKTVQGGTKNLFSQPSKRTKPAFPSGLLNTTADKTLGNKTKELVTEVKTQPKALFGNRLGTKRKNMFADFIVSESEDEIPEIQPKLFAFNKHSEPTRRSSTTSRGLRDPSPTSSITTDIEMDDWKLLPSSTMVEHQLEANLNTPSRRTRLSKLSEAKESINTNSTKQTNQSTSSKNKSKSSQNKEKSLLKDADTSVSNKSTASNKSKVNSSKLKDDVKEMSDVKNKSKVIKNQEDNLNQDQEMELDRITEDPQDDPEEEAMNLTYEDNESQDTERNSDKTKPHIDDKTKTINKDTTRVSENYDKSKSRIVDKTKTIIKDTTGITENIDNSKPHIDDKTKTINKDTTEKDFVYDDLETELSKIVGQENDVVENTPINNKSIHSTHKVVEETPESNIDEQSFSKQISEGLNDKDQVDVLDNQVQNKSGKVIEENVHNHTFKDKADLVENEHEATIQEDIEDQIEASEEDQAEASQEIDANDQEVTDAEVELENDEEEEHERQLNASEDVLEDEVSQIVHDSSQEAEDNDDQEEVEEKDEEEDDEHMEEDDEVIEEDAEDDPEAVEQDEPEDEEVDGLEVVQEEDEEVVASDGEMEENDDQEENAISNEVEASAGEVEDNDEQEEKEVSNEVEEDGDYDEHEEIEATDDDVQNQSEVDDNAEDQHESAEIEEQDDDDDRENAQESDYEQEQENEQHVENQEKNISHDTTGRNRKKRETDSPEAILHDEIPAEMNSFTGKGRNTSIRKTILKNLTLRPSMAPPRDSTGFSDGTKNSSAEGSGWDSHRTTRKTLRQTFGRDFTPRKSLRALVMEKSAKRQTVINEANADLKLHQANSTEIGGDQDEMVYEESVGQMESDHEMSPRTKQTTLEMYMQKVKRENMERKLKIEQQVKNSLKSNINRDLLNFRVPSKPTIRRAIKPLHNAPKPKRLKSSIIDIENLPPELIDDMKYKPPKRFRPSNASWITKRLYKFLETKLEPRYDYKARVRAEKLVESIYNFVRDTKRLRVATSHSIAELKKEMARLDVVSTHFEFYNFFNDYMPMEVKIKVVPDIVNDIPVPREGIFAPIIAQV